MRRVRVRQRPVREREHPVPPPVARLVQRALPGQVVRRGPVLHHGPAGHPVREARVQVALEAHRVQVELEAGRVLAAQAGDPLARELPAGGRRVAVARVTAGAAVSWSSAA